MKSKDRSKKLKTAHAKCIEAFGGIGESIQWMATDNRSLGGRPLDLIDTDDGLESVLNELDKIIKINMRAAGLQM